jgi:phytanoyl-CoA hydroxylase
MGLFGELWVDEPDAAARVDALVRDDLRPFMKEYVERGYTIFRNVVPQGVVDQVVQDTQALFKYPERYVAKNGINNPRGYIDPAELTEFRKGDRVSDIFGVSPAARAAIYPELISDFLYEIFREPAIAMQSISFEYGSQQAIHQDTAYVVSKRPNGLAATWLALEDVQLGTGELIYYPGSHRFDHFLFSNQTKSWNPGRDGQEQHKAFLAQLHEQARSRGIQVERFLARRGDILVWHSDLAHGGARIQQPDATRRSLVTHFCPFSVKPHYMDVIGADYFELEYNQHSYFTSRHFAMRDLLTADRARIIFDGGVSAERAKASLLADGRTAQNSGARA